MAIKPTRCTWVMALFLGAAVMATTTCGSVSPTAPSPTPTVTPTPAPPPEPTPTPPPEPTPAPPPEPTPAPTPGPGPYQSSLSNAGALHVLENFFFGTER